MDGKGWWIAMVAAATLTLFGTAYFLPFK